MHEEGLYAEYLSGQRRSPVQCILTCRQQWWRKAASANLIRRLRKFLASRGGKQNCADAGWHSATGRGIDGNQAVEGWHPCGGVLFASTGSTQIIREYFMQFTFNEGPHRCRLNGRISQCSLVSTRITISIVWSLPQRRSTNLTRAVPETCWRCHGANLMGTPNMPITLASRHCMPVIHRTVRKMRGESRAD